MSSERPETGALRNQQSRGREDEPFVADGRAGPSPADGALRRIGAALNGLRYGSVLVIVQDGVVVQIDRTEKTRLTR